MKRTLTVVNVYCKSRVVGLDVARDGNFRGVRRASTSNLLDELNRKKETTAIRIRNAYLALAQAIERLLTLIWAHEMYHWGAPTT